MRKTQPPKSGKPKLAEMRAEYRFDYRKACPNRFAGRGKEGRLVVVLEADIAEVFTTPEAVKNALRALSDDAPAEGQSVSQVA